MTPAYFISLSSPEHSRELFICGKKLDVSILTPQALSFRLQANPCPGYGETTCHVLSCITLLLFLLPNV